MRELLERPVIGLTGFIATASGTLVARLEVITAVLRLVSGVFAVIAGALTIAWWIWHLRREVREFSQWRKNQ